MDEAARETLTKLKAEIKKNLNLDEDILDDLEAKNTLKSDHVEKIKAEKTNSEKISLLLFILKRKGPEAFQDFLDALNHAEYGYLADKLLERYHEEEKKFDKDSGNSSEGSYEQTERKTPSTNSFSSDVPSGSQSIFPNVSGKTTQRSNRGQEAAIVPNNRCINREEGSAVRRLSNSAHSNNNFLHTSISSRRTSNHSVDIVTHQMLSGMYTKLKNNLFHLNEREQSFGGSPVPVTSEMVEELLDKLLKLLKDCNKVLGVNNKSSLQTNIINLKLKNKDLQDTINRKEEQVQKYATKILKLETRCKNMESTCQLKENTIVALKAENKRLSEENEKLIEETGKFKHSDIETGSYTKSLTLRQMCKQNEELKTKVALYEQELKTMTEKCHILSQPQCSPRAQQSLGISNQSRTIIDKQGNEKETVANERVSDKMFHRSQIGDSSSISQECKDITVGIPEESSNRSINIRNMKNKILFAETKQTNSTKKVKSQETFRSNNILQKALYDGQATSAEKVTKVRKQIPTEQGCEGTERLYQAAQTYRSDTSNIPTCTNSSVRQKTALSIKRQPTFRAQKKTPKWVRKPLR